MNNERMSEKWLLNVKTNNQRKKEKSKHSHKYLFYYSLLFYLGLSLQRLTICIYMCVRAEDDAVKSQNLLIIVLFLNRTQWWLK